MTDHVPEGSPAPGPSGDPDHLLGLEELRYALRYRRFLFEIIAPHLHGRILEVGAGRGDFAWLFPEDASMMVTDVDPGNVADLRARFEARPATEVRTFEPTKDTLAPAANSAVAINVAEHIEDDVAWLRGLARSIRPGGNVVLFVPGYPSLYGEFDRAIGHQRRYTPATLRQTVTSAGLIVEHLRPVNLIGGIAWWLAVKLGRQTRPHPTLVKIYDRIVVPLVRLIERRWVPPFGQSVLCVATVPPCE